MKKVKVNQDKVFYVALGDSLTKGTGTLIKPNFVKLYAEYIEASLDKKVSTLIFAQNGAETEDILAKMDYQVVKFALKHAQVITISAGGNDLRQAAEQYFKSGDEDVLHRTLRVYEHNMRSMLKKIQRIKDKQSPYLVRIINIYNPYVDYALADKWLERFNGVLKKMQSKQVKVANIYPLFKGREQELLALDKLHPNGEGYALIAQCLDRLGYSPIKRE